MTESSFLIGVLNMGIIIIMVHSKEDEEILGEKAKKMSSTVYWMLALSPSPCRAPRKGMRDSGSNGNILWRLHFRTVFYNLSTLFAW